MNVTREAPPSAIVSILSAYTRKIPLDEIFPTSLLLVVFAFYALSGRRLDLLGNLVFLIYLNRWSLISCIHGNVQHIFVALLCAVGSVTLRYASTSRNNDPWHGPGRPYLIPCRTTHRRFFPQKHSFEYSYLMVGVPVDYDGNANGMIEIKKPPPLSVGGIFNFSALQSSGWFRVKASDHLQRDHDEFSLRAKLDSYLLSEKTDPKDYPYAYLVTAATFMGYQFNPVSLWYLYSPERTLSAILLEVNNTYDERHSYLVTRDAATELESTSARKQPRFRSSHAKEFYVSPFNSRNGVYSVVSSDPLGTEMAGFRGLDITITLASSNGHTKLVARLFSDGPAIDPTVLGTWEKFRFLLSWFWVGFATVPRIVKEALVLLYRRKLHMYDKPEPLIETIGRRATTVERSLEVCFRNYLESKVSHYSDPLLVKYHPSGLPTTSQVTFTSPCDANSEISETLEIRILTPAFYSQLVRHDAILSTVWADLQEKKMLWVNRLDLLASVFNQTPCAPQPMGLLDTLFMYLTRYLQQSGSDSVSSSASSVLLDHSTSLGARTNNCPSSMIGDLVMTCEDKTLKRRCQWAIIQQLLAENYFICRVEIISALFLVARVLLAWRCAAYLTNFLETYISIVRTTC